MFKENYKKYLAEFIGTAALVLVGCGVVAFWQGNDALAVVLAFGLTVTMMAYSVGQISGGHFNPAVTLAAWINKRVDGKNACFYVLSQILGGLTGGLLLFLLLTLTGVDSAIFGAQMGINTVPVVADGGSGIVLALLVEILATFLFTLVIIGVTNKKENGKIAGIVIGLALAILLALAGPITGGSLNPARSIGVAFFDTTNIADIWVFIVAPIAGGALGGLLGKVLFKPETTDAQ